MAQVTLSRVHELKQELSDFVLDAEGDLATALETFSATELSRSQQQDLHKRSLVIDRFLTEGKVGTETPIKTFIAQSNHLTQAEQALLDSWHHAFVGLFEIVQISADHFVLKNWTTAKQYIVRQANSQAIEAMQRLKQGEIILTQIAPLSETEWFFFSPWTSLGKLGKPKLAVAIGNFKNNYKSHLYSDAPELLEEAWKSVANYHQHFIDFFDTDEVTRSGYQLSKDFAALQQKISQAQMQASGLDGTKTLAELAEAAGTSEAELTETAEAMGLDAEAVAQAMQQKQTHQMAPTQVDLPAHLKQADEVTVFTHPRWGQTFLTNYKRLEAILQNPTAIADAESATLIRQFLETNDANPFVWQRLAEKYPSSLEKLIQFALDRPNFKLGTDLDSLLQEFNKPTEPELPEIASVPVHLHTLFQDAVLELNRTKSKSKGKTRKPQPAALGFRR